MKPGHFSSRPGQVGSRMFKAWSRHSQENIFHINTSSRNENHPALLNFSLYNNSKRRACCLTFLRSSQTKLLEKKILSKFKNIIKYLNMNSQQQMNKITKNDLFKCGFLRTLLTWQQCIQNIPNNLREADWKEGSAWLFFG